MFSKVFALFAVASALVSAAPLEQPIERTTHTGTATYFAVGLGACGWVSLISDSLLQLHNSSLAPRNSPFLLLRRMWQHLG
jgi:hypothetical protein